MLRHARFPIVLLAGAAVLVLSGCGSSPHSAAASSTAASSSGGAALDPSNCQDSAFYAAHTEFCASEVTTTPAAATAKVGEVVPFNGGNSVGTITLVSAKRVTVTDPAADLATRGESGSYLVAEVLVQVSKINDGTSLLVSGYDFTAQDPAGNVHQVTYTPLDDMFSMEVPAGRQVRGQVAFDIPTGSNLIDWNPGFGGPAATWGTSA